MTPLGSAWLTHCPRRFPCENPVYDGANGVEELNTAGCRYSTRVPGLFLLLEKAGMAGGPVKRQR